MTHYGPHDLVATAGSTDSTMRRLWLLVCLLRLLAALTAFVLGFFGEFRDAGFLSPWNVGVPVLAYAVFGPLVQWRTGKDSPSVSLAIADSVVGLTAVALSGGWQSPYFLILLPAVVSASLVARFSEGLLISLLISGIYVLTAAIAVSRGEQGNEIDVITDNFAILLVTSLVTGTLNQQWRNESRNRGQKEQVARRLGILNRLLSETFPVSLDQDSAMRTTADLTRAAMESDVAGVLICDVDGWRVWASPPLPQDVSFAGTAVTATCAGEDGVLQVEDLNAVGLNGPPWNQLGMKGLALAPIYAGERLHGYLFAGHRSPYRFSEEERHLLTAICHHIGLGARNADLYALEREQVQRLREIERLKTDFFNNVSHDLLTPLGAVTTATGLLVSDRDSRLSPLATSLLANIARNAERLNVMVKDLLEVARIQSGRITLKRTSVDPGVILRDAVDAVAPQFRAKEQHLEVQAPPEMTPLWADGERLERVLINLLQNAHTHTPPGGKVSVVVDQPDGVVRFAVLDTGPGIEPDQLDRVFERFYRPEGSAARGGAGLGLSIAKTLVELHGGKISVENSPGAGARFVVEVPVGVEDENSDC